MLQTVEPERPLPNDCPAALQTDTGREGLQAVPSAERQPKRSLGVALKLGASLAGLLLVVWLLARTWIHSAPAAVPESERGSVQRPVRVAMAVNSEASQLTLPANVDAYQTTSLYSRVSGYLSKWHFDIGDSVQKGQALAEIDTPEADQELGQARASLVQGKADLAMAQAELLESQAKLKQGKAEIARAKANLGFALSVLKRNEQLSESKVISAQDLDENRRDGEMRQAEMESAEAQYTTLEATVATAQAKIESRQATVASLEANVRRLEEHQEFKTIRAPFDGVVTRRRAEVGMLVAAGNASSSQELFAVAQADRLRIRVNVPQAMTRSIEIGQKAQVLVPELPNQPLTAAVTRTAQAVDPTSRTLGVELELANEDHRLLPGTYAQVVLSLRKPEGVCTVPAGVLTSRPEGMKVGVLDSQNVVHLRDVKLGRDYGTSVEVLSGLTGSERLVANPPDDLLDGEQVTVVETPATR